jgi:hypothetical protein
MKRIVFLLIVVGLGAAVKYLPWWGSVLIFLGLIVVAKFVAKYLLKKLIVLPFKAKGAVLRGATAQVHSITAIAPPAPDQAAGDADDLAEPDKAAVPRSYYQFDVTITPQDATGNFTHWEPGELRLMRPESGVGVDDETDDGSCTVRSLEIQEEAGFKPYEGMKYPGPQRLRMTVGVQEGVTALKFRYYFEAFGEVRLPAPVAKAA